MKPYIENETLIIPFDSDKKYHWWNGGQSVIETLRELGRMDLEEKYKTQLKGRKPGCQ